MAPGAVCHDDPMRLRTEPGPRRRATLTHRAMTPIRAAAAKHSLKLR